MPKRKVSEKDVAEEVEEEDEEESGSDGDSEDGSSGSSGSESGDGDGDDGFPEVSDKDEDDGDEDDDEDDDDKAGDLKQGGVKQITIEFEFFPPKEIDFHGLKALLTTYLDGQQYDSSGLVNSILKQDKVGSVVKTSEEDDPIAVFTVLSTVAHKAQEWLQQLRAFLASKAKDDAARQQLEQAFELEGTGLLLTERLINCPPKLAPPLMQFLFQEVKEAAAGSLGLPKQDQESFRFKRYIIATRVYEDTERSATDTAGPSSSKGPAKKAKMAAGSPSAEPVLVYLRPEDEFLHKHCAWSYTFPVEGRSVGKDDLQPLRMVMLVDASKIAAVRKSLDSVVGNMAAE